MFCNVETAGGVRRSPFQQSQIWSCYLARRITMKEVVATLDLLTAGLLTVPGALRADDEGLKSR
jgi:hypothetical protein